MKLISTLNKTLVSLALCLLAHWGMAQKICLVGSPADMSGLSADEANAYQWAIDTYGSAAAYLSFADISASGLPGNCKVVWYHHQGSTDVPADALAAAVAIEAHLAAGGGVFLSGHGTKYITDINATTVGTTETINNPNATADAAWGFRQTPGQEAHPIFSGISNSTWPNPDWGGFRTVAEGTQTQETISWWTGGAFPGTQLASLPWLPAGQDLTTLGVLQTTGGAVAVATAPGFAWGSLNPTAGAERDNLEKLTSNIIDYITPADPRIVLVGSPASMSGLSADEANAYQWAMSAYPGEVGYSSFNEVAANGLPAATQVVWYHLQSGTSVPADADAAASEIEGFLFAGGGLFLSGHGTKYITNVNATTVGTTETINNPTATADAAWGFRQTPGQEGHPFFAGLANSTWPNPDWGGIRTVAQGTQTQETISWWTGGSFPGTQLASLPWLPAGQDLTTLGTLSAGSGKVAVATAPGFAWGSLNPTPGPERDNLEQLTSNILDFISPKVKIVVVGSPADLSGLSADEANAYQWAMSNYGAEAGYLSFNSIAANGLPPTAEVVWYHLQSGTDIPADATAAAADIEDFLFAGGGLFLSGHGTKYATAVNATTVGTTETINNPTATADAAWGFRQTPGQETHPFFAGLANSTWPNPDWGGIRTVAQGTQTQETISWWTGGSFPGTQLASLPWLPAGTDLAILGTLDAGEGIVAVASAPGFAWGSLNPTPGAERDNLELLTENILEFIRPSISVEPKVLLLGAPADLSGLSEDEQNAYAYAQEVFGNEAQYVSFIDLAANGIPFSTQVIWYHQQSSVDIPAAATAVGTLVGDWVQNHQGLFLSGHATKFITATGATTVGPTETINNQNVTSDAAWGLRPTTGQQSHPAFAGLPASPWPNPDWGGFRTITEGSVTNEVISWWTNSSYPGIQLATVPWLPANAGIATSGELAYGTGAIIHATAPGYSWQVYNGTNGATEQANLELFTKNILEYLFDPAPAPRLLVSSPAGDVILEGSENGVTIDCQLESVIFVDPIDPAQWQVLNLPPNVSVGSIVKTNDQHAVITLSGTASDYDTDIQDFTIQVPASQLVGFGGAFLESVGDLTFDAVVELEVSQIKLALLGDKANFSDLDLDEQTAYNWALDNFPNAEYVQVHPDSFLSADALNVYEVAWWHFDGDSPAIELPLDFNNPLSDIVMQNFVNSGKAVFLSAAATQYVTNLGVTDKGPNQLQKSGNPFVNPDAWGYGTPVPNHPVFENLTNPFFTLNSATGLREDLLSLWNIDPAFDPNIPPADRFDGVQLTSAEWDGGFTVWVSTAEFSQNDDHGSVICVGAGAYDWYLENGVNELAPDLQTYTYNILTYLGGTVNPSKEPGKAELPVTAAPNPFSDKVGFYFSTEEATALRIEMFDAQGRLVALVADNEPLPAGAHHIDWVANGQPSGFYFYKVTAGNGVAAGKVFLEKR